jgi:hypothetical protein
MIDFGKNGLQTFLFCLNTKDIIYSFWETGKMFFGGLGLRGKISLFLPKIPKYQEEANKIFLKDNMDLNL